MAWTAASPRSAVIFSDRPNATGRWSCSSQFRRPREGGGRWRHGVRGMRRAYVYIMTNKPMGIVYIGVTDNLPARIFAHRSGTGSEFCKK
ncbi:GIY-YIG nuclease family protein [Sphingopyxis sp.]|uniref:GIY-YIG nuclease family protein n=1 Tax=Sphingopyxis sp. TaxID=1908224 RepID=UPI0039C9ED3D